MLTYIVRNLSLGVKECVEQVIWGPQLHIEIGLGETAWHQWSYSVGAPLLFWWYIWQLQAYSRGKIQKLVEFL